MTARFPSNDELPGGRDPSEIPARVLVAGHEDAYVERLRGLMTDEPCDVTSVASAAAALEALESREFDVLLVNLDEEHAAAGGLFELVARAPSLDRELPVVVTTNGGRENTAAEAMRRGACDVVQLPGESERLGRILWTQAELCRALRRGERLEVENRLLREGERSYFLSRSTAMRPVREVMERVGSTDANVLITGESGCGKHAVARALFMASARSARPLVTVERDATIEAIFGSALSDREKGVLSGARAERVGRLELADGGALLLEEVAAMPLSGQARLVRVAETGEFERVGSPRTRRVSVRMFSATGVDLSAEVVAGRFRRDLLLRLNPIEIPIPPLRERVEDIPLLAHHFLSLHVARARRLVRGFEPAALEAMRVHRWPGNVRELDRAVERGVLTASRDGIGAADLGLPAGKETPRSLDEMSLDEVEAYLVQTTLTRFGNNVSLAANALGLSRGTLYRRLEKHGLMPRGSSATPTHAPAG